MKKIAVLSFIFASLLAHGQGSINRTDDIYLDYFNSLTSKVDRYWHDGMFEECITLLRLQTSVDPADMDAKKNLEWMLENVGRVGDGIVLSTQFVIDSPTNEDVIELQAYVVYNLKLYDRVAALLEPMIERATMRNIFVLLTDSYEQMGLIKEAIRVLELRRAKMPTDLAINVNLKRLQDKLSGKIPIKSTPPKRVKSSSNQHDPERESKIIPR